MNVHVIKQRFDLSLFLSASIFSRLCVSACSDDETADVSPVMEDLEDTTIVNLAPNDFDLVGVSDSAIRVDAFPIFTGDCATADPIEGIWLLDGTLRG
ncbi:MAG: hypothetical protein AAF149_24785 [Bacteroidota bacterium]